jgi:signal transduction histidine kinase
MHAEHFRFSPDILRRLGEELVPHIDQSIVELVRNAYDADAVTCRVELLNADELGGTLRVTDDGVGMTPEAIRNGWLVLGRSAKTAHQPTPLGRTPVGDKGLGRLAALRMGDVATLRSRPAARPGTELVLTLDWSRYDAATAVEDVVLVIGSRQTEESPGTTIEVANLRVRLGRQEVERLARVLVLLADPFDASTGFHPVLVAPAFKDLEQRVREAYFDDAEYHLVAMLDEQGCASARVFDGSGKERWTATHEDVSKGPRKTAPIYRTSSARFELWAFNVSTRSFAPHTPLRELRRWLAAVGGIHLYHRGLRVHPYGDPGYDWLDMNLARVRSPELRPSTNTSIGRVVVTDLQQRLIQKTDRSGFIENEAFSELRRFAQDALEWMAAARLSEREARRIEERARAPQVVAQAKATLTHTIESLPPEDRHALQAAVGRLDAAREQEARTLREDLQLYRTLGTVGTTTAVFAHEAAKPVTQIEMMAATIERRGRGALGEKYATFLENPVCNILRSARALKSFAALPLRLLAREKRRTGRIDVHVVVHDMLELFEPFLSDARINVRLELMDPAPVVQASVASIEAILANLLTNAVHAFESEDMHSDLRDVVIRTELSGGDRLLLRLLDTGPGITHLSVDDIWLPGQSSRPGGTGLGLTIVRDTVSDLGGAVRALPHGELGGAEFVVELPVALGAE